MKDAEYIKYKIKDKGYMTATQITLDLSDELNSEEIKNILIQIEEDREFHKIEYTNRYVAPYTTKKMYFYNPKLRKRTRRKTKKKVSKGHSSK